MTEFHRLALLAPLDQLRVVLEDRVHFLVNRNLLSIQHSAASLVDDRPAQVAVSRDLPAELSRSPRGGLHRPLTFGGLFDHLARVFSTCSVIRSNSRYLGTCCVCRWEADIRSSSCMRRRALRVRLVKPCTPRGNSSWSLSTSRVTVRTVSHNKVASVG